MAKSLKETVCPDCGTEGNFTIRPCTGMHVCRSAVSPHFHVRCVACDLWWVRHHDANPKRVSKTRDTDLAESVATEDEFGEDVEAEVEVEPVQTIPVSRPQPQPRPRPVAPQAPKRAVVPAYQSVTTATIASTFTPTPGAAIFPQRKRRKP